MNIRKHQIFYSVKASTVAGGSLLGRGLFDLLRDAQTEADKYPAHEIWRHEDASGVRVKNELLYSADGDKQSETAAERYDKEVYGDRWHTPMSL